VAIIHKLISLILRQTIYASKKKTKILLYSWLPTGTYHKNLTKLGHFFHGKSFVWVKIVLFKSKFGKISPKTNPLIYQRQVSFGVTHWSTIGTTKARVNQHPPVHHPTGVLVGAGSLWLTTKASQDTIRPSAKHFSHILSQAVAVVSLTTSQLPPLQDTPPS
jgi:hypothetical protein